MKFETGDQTDQRLIQALQHEYRRSTDAFADFLACAPVLVTGGGDRDLRYAAYNAYARLLHHLYEFLMGCAARRRGDTRPLRANEAEALITDHLQRILNARRTVILAGRAQPWENGLEAYPETAPSGFASAFRRCRNITQAHVAADRSTLDLSDFYQRNHGFIVMMLEDAALAWGPREGGFPDLGAVTGFSISA